MQTVEKLEFSNINNNILSEIILPDIVGPVIGRLFTNLHQTILDYTSKKSSFPTVHHYCAVKAVHSHEFNVFVVSGTSHA